MIWISPPFDQDLDMSCASQVRDFLVKSIHAPFFLSFFPSFFVAQSKSHKKSGTAWALSDGDRLQFGQEGEIAGCTDVCDGMVARTKQRCCVYERPEGLLDTGSLLKMT